MLTGLQSGSGKKPGNERRLLTNGKRAGSFPDAHEIVAECARQYGADVEPDDITVEM